MWIRRAFNCSDKKSSNDGSNFWLRRVFKPLGGGTSTSLQIDFGQWTHRESNPQLCARNVGQANGRNLPRSVATRLTFDLSREV
jgi:hypothetical protein